MGAIGISLMLMLTHTGCGSIPGSLRIDHSTQWLGQAPESGSRVRKRLTNEKAQTLIRLALEQYRAGKFESARSTLRLARRADPYDTRTHEIEAHIALDMGEGAEYVTALRCLLLANPNAARMQNAAGKLLIQTGRFDEGVKHLRRAVALAPRVTHYAHDLAATYSARGRFQAAEQVLTEAIAEKPYDRSLPIAMARLYESTGNWQSAATYYHMALTDDPNNFRWRRQQARCLYQSGDYDEACRLFAECLDRTESDVSLADRVQYGDACLQIGDFAAAQKVFDEVSRRIPNRWKEIELLRGLCALKRGATTDARGIFDTALTHWPHDRDLQQVLALCAAEAKE